MHHSTCRALNNRSGAAPATEGILQRKCACGGTLGQDQQTLHPKLRVNRPGDRYEQEADRVAEQVMRMPAPEEALHRDPLVGRITPLLQRQVDPEEEEEEELLQTKHTPGAVPEVTPLVASEIASMRGGGEPMPVSERAFFEPRFGHDFSRVRIHADGRAASAARSVQARAFTVGRDVVFGAGEYQPGTEAGRRLLAHELVHTLQQGEPSQVQRERSQRVPVPSVVNWTVRASDGEETEDDNRCRICPVNLGVDVDPINYVNGIELKATLRNHWPGYSYDIKRTLEAQYWQRDPSAPSPWSTISFMNSPAGTDDDLHNEDEWRMPVAVGSNHKIYSTDLPGISPTLIDHNYTDYVQKINFIEFVRITKPDGTDVDDATQQNWHTTMWLTQSHPHALDWSINEDESEIGTGHLSSLSP